VVVSTGTEWRKIRWETFAGIHRTAVRGGVELAWPGIFMANGELQIAEGSENHGSDGKHGNYGKWKRRIRAKATEDRGADGDATRLGFPVLELEIRKDGRMIRWRRHRQFF
jgi:hypothetical protein